MVAGTADLRKSMNDAWDSSSLDNLFKTNWDEDTGEFYVLNDQEAPDGQQWPYAVIDQLVQTVVVRTSSKEENKKFEIRTVEVRLNVHTQKKPDTGTDPQVQAANLAEEVMKVFGGHPTERPSASLSLENGSILQMRYMDDFGVRTGEDEYQWVVVYVCTIDVPVMV